jgi:hypothetical protein
MSSSKKRYYARRVVLLFPALTSQLKSRHLVVSALEDANKDDVWFDQRCKSCSMALRRWLMVGGCNLGVSRVSCEAAETAISYENTSRVGCQLQQQLRRPQQILQKRAFHTQCIGTGTS